MLIESLEGRRLFSVSPIATQAQAGGVGDLAQSDPGAVAAVAKPTNVGALTATPSTPSQANPVASQTRTIATTAQSSPGAVSDIARPA
jgi:hypothetical protein